MLPLITDAQTAAVAEEVLPTPHVSLSERGEAIPIIEIHCENTLAAQLALVRDERRRVDEVADRGRSAGDVDVAVGEAGDDRHHGNTIPFELGAEPRAALDAEDVAVG